jgi:sugar phosphate permease
MSSKHWRAALMVAVAIVLAVAAILVWEAFEPGDSGMPAVHASMPDKEFVERGAYLARVGN